MTKKKLLIVKECTNDLYGNQLQPDRLYYAFVSKPENDIRSQCHPFVTCRDYLNDVLRKHHFKSMSSLNYSGYMYGKSPSIDLDKVRLLVTSTKDAKERIFSAKAALNVYEELAGWKPSTITTVHHKSTANAWLLTGPKQWLKYANLLSMYTLILRLGFNHGPIPHENIEEITNFWQQLISKNDRGCHYDDITYLKSAYNKFPVIMKYYEELFTDDISIAFRDPKHYGSSDFHNRGGIYEMCIYRTNLGELDTKFKEACEKEGAL